MKNLLIVIFSIFIFSCGSPQEIVTTITEYEAFEYFEMADSAAISLVNTLGGRLVDAIQNKGVIEAIDVCHKEAYEITDDLTKKFDSIKSIKRVSNKYRNPQNAPDKYESEVLNWFEEQLASGAKPLSFGQKISRKKRNLIRYYKPIIIQNKCLLCHGDDNSRLPDVSKKIDELYPNDLAKDYNEGDFRGFIRIEIETENI
jgi:hypothetical protein